MSNDIQFFTAFFQNKINQGVRQKTIADKTGIPVNCIHGMYKGKVKKIPPERLTKIAKYFEVSYEEIIQEGKKLFEKKPNDTPLKGKNTTADLILEVLAQVKEKDEQLEIIDQLKEKIEFHLMVLENLHESVTFFDERRELVFSSNRWCFLDEEDLVKTPSLETLVLKMRRKIENSEEVLDALFLSSEKREKVTIDVKLKSGEIFHIRAVPVIKNDTFKGTLLINTRKNPPLEND